MNLKNLLPPTIGTQMCLAHSLSTNPAPTMCAACYLPETWPARSSADISMAYIRLGYLPPPSPQRCKPPLPPQAIS